MTTTQPYADWRRGRGCDRKRAWSSETLARNFATLRQWADPTEQPQHPYRCDWCTEWHLTSQPVDQELPDGSTIEEGTT